MAKQLTKEEFIEVAKEFGYDINESLYYVSIYFNNEIDPNNLIACINIEYKRGK